MLTQVLIAGISLGLLSSFHCVGMCGPLALSLPVQGLSKQNKSLALLLYNAGRVITYCTLGVLFGLIGRSFYIAGFQQWISILAGVFILLTLSQYFLFKTSYQPALLGKWYAQVQRWIIVLWKNPNMGSFLLLGVANGLLPCGMVYIAIAASLTSSHVEYSAIFMTAFGLGTLPAMFGLSYFGYLINLSARNKMKKMMPFFMGVVGVILILRGLNLGIPFLSPVLASPASTAVICR